MSIGRSGESSSLRGNLISIMAEALPSEHRALDGFVLSRTPRPAPGPEQRQTIDDLMNERRDSDGRAAGDGGEDGRGRPRRESRPAAGQQRFAHVRVRDLRISFGVEGGSAEAVRGVDLEVGFGETVAIVGESGSGKSATALALMGLLPDNARVSGSIEVGGVDILTKDERFLREKVRGQQVGMVFQDPMTTLNPVLRVGRQVTEGLVAHGRIDRRSARRRASELLMPGAHQRQRTASRPISAPVLGRDAAAGSDGDGSGVAARLVDRGRAHDGARCDHPGAGVAAVPRGAARDRGRALLLISHDLGVVAGVTNRIYVMYAGRIVESGPVEDVFLRPRHPYTVGIVGERAERRTSREAVGGDARAAAERRQCAGRVFLPAALRGQPRERRSV